MDEKDWQKANPPINDIRKKLGYPTYDGSLEDALNVVNESEKSKEVVDVPVTYTTTVDGTNIWGWRKLALEANAAACKAMAECDALKTELQKYKEYYGALPTPEEGS